MRASAIWCWLVISVAVLAAPVVAAPIALIDGAGPSYIRKDVQMLVDPTGTMTVEQAATASGYGKFGPMPDPHAAYWLRFTYDATASDDVWYLFLGYKPNTVELYTPKKGGGYRVQRSGLATPYSERPVRAYGVVAFTLVRGARETVYARVMTQEPDLTIAIDPSALFWKVNLFNLMAIVALDSVLIAFLVSAIALFFMARNNIFLLYALYLIAEILYRSNIAGILAAYIWPHLAFYPAPASSVVDAVRIIALTLMMREFLKLRMHSLIMDYLNLGIVAFAAVYGLLAGVGVHVPFALGPELALVYVPIWIFSAIVAWRRGEEQAPLVILAWSVFMLGSYAFALKQLTGFGRGDLTTEQIISHGTDIGIALQGLFLSLALSSELQALSRAKDRFEKLSVHDALTGVGNRRLFETALAREWTRALRSQKPLSLLVVDIDHFKGYNDSYGHIAGDVALCEVARCGEASMRGGDLFCRYGGEEFVAILPEADEEGAMSVAERVQRSVLEAKIEYEKSESGVLTVSIGVVSMKPQSDGSSSTLFERADQALYRAKEHGRNRIEVAIAV